MLDHVSPEICEARHTQLKDQAKVLFKKIEVIEQISITLAQFEIISKNQEKTMAEMSSTMKEVSIILGSVQQQVKGTDDSMGTVKKDLDAVKKAVEVLQDDNTVKISVVIKNVVFTAIGAAVGALATYWVSVKLLSGGS